VRRTDTKRATPALIAAFAALLLLFTAARASAASVPSIEGEAVSQITATDATLEAQINPNGLETSYRFRVEFGCFSSHSECLWISEEKIPTARLSPSSQAQSASLNLNEAGVTLHPGWEYRYSVEGTNSAGPTVRSPEQTFTTPSMSAPLIEGESLSHLTPTDATLEAQINTDGSETTYEFELQTVACSSHGAGCELAPHPISLPSGKLLGSFVGQKVSLDLNSAGVTLGKGEWFYTVTASNPDGTATGAFHQFEAPLPGAPSIAGESASAVTEHDATLEAQINPESLEMWGPLSVPGRQRPERISVELRLSHRRISLPHILMPWPSCPDGGPAL
jgi:hypothetical protein